MDTIKIMRDVSKALIELFNYITINIESEDLTTRYYGIEYDLAELLHDVNALLHERSNHDS